jgi:hypothetical protein
MNSTDLYFAVLGDDELAQECLKLRKNYLRVCETLGLRNTWRLTYCQQLGLDPANVSASAGVQAFGDVDGINELRLRSNIVRPINRQAVLLAMGDRPGYSAVATNIDVASQAQVGLVSKLLDYVTTEAGIEEIVFAAAESNRAFGSGGVHITWDPGSGDLVDAEEPATDPDTKEPLMVQDEAGNPVPYMKPVKKPSGDVKLTRCFPWSVARDPLLEDSPWVLISEPISRHELAAMYPHKRAEILAAPGPDAQDCFELLGFTQSIATDDVVVLHSLYHRSCKAVPGGRYFGFVEGAPLWSRRCPVQDGLPYAEIKSSTYFGTSIGHPEAADLASLQEVYDDLLSTAITNLARYKDQVLYVDERIKWDGEKTIYTLPADVEPPKTAQYQQLPESTKWMLEWIPQQMIRSAGLNDTALGDPPGANTSGVAIVTLTQTAQRLQRATQLGIDQAYNQIGNIVLAMLRANASNGFVAELAGYSDAPLVRFFTAQDLEGVKRVKITRSNPVLNTWAGKLELLNAIKDEPVDSRRKIVEMFNTNSFEPLFEGDTSQTDLLRWENAEMQAGRPVVVNLYDDHKIHMPVHRSQLDKIRMMPDSPEKISAINAYAAHMKEHVALALQVDPTAAALLGQPAYGQQAQQQVQPADKPQD